MAAFEPGEAAFEVGEDKLYDEYFKRLANPQPLVEVPSADAPVHAVTITGKDSNGNTVTSDTSTVTLTLQSGTFAGGSNTASAAAVNGIATFDSLVINTAGSYLLRATDTNPNLDPGYGPFTINPAAAAKKKRERRVTATSS